GGTTSSTSSNWDLAFGRYNENGTPDPTFDGDGIKSLTLGSGVEEIKALAIQPDGKIVAGGFVFPTTSDSAFALVRLNPDGSLDPSFDGDGKVTTPIGDGDFPRNEIRSIAVLSDGKIVAGGKGNDGTIGGESSNNVMRLARYNPDGSLDTTFDTDGIVSTNLADDRFDEIGAIAVQHDDKIVAFASTLHQYVSNYDFVVARYNWDDGSLDATYGADNLGYTLTSLSPSADLAAGGVVVPGGAAVAGGTAGNSDMGAARWLGDPPPVLPGAPDLDPGSDSGVLATDNVTNDQTPLVVGVAPGCNVGETTIVKVNGAVTSPLTRALCRNGNWSLSPAALPDGVHTFSAFSRNGFGDTADTATLSVTVDTVAVAPTIASPADEVTVQFPPAPSISGTIGETVAGSVVKVMEGPAELCSVTVDGSGSWSCTPDLAEGPHTITARLTDVAGNASTASAPVDFTVSKGDTVTELVSALNPSTFGDDVTVSISVTSPAGASPGPTGTVDVVVDGAAPQTLALTDGAATVALDGAALAVGPHTVSAAYGGDGNYATSTAGLTQTVNQAGAAVALTSSPNPSTDGEAVTFTATVTPAQTGRPAEPTGEVEFVIDGGAPVKVAMRSPATYTVALGAGNHAVSARYLGDANFAAASAELSGGQVVNALPVAPPPDGPGGGDDIGAGLGGSGTGGTGTDVGTGGTGTDVGGATGTNPGGTGTNPGGAGDSLSGGTLPRTGGSATAALTMLGAALLGVGATGLAFRRRDERPR
ncbi:MAG: Ig-like domain repeat protein, partial [Acidimicrobiia bacterium]